MILRESKEEETLNQSREIENASQNLLGLVNDILDISKIESGKLEIFPVEYDLSELIKTVVSMISYKAKAKGLKLEINIDESLPSVLYGDDVRIRQILVNLLNNAIKYTENGSVTFNLSGLKREEKIELRFEIKDTGIGIKEEDMDKLFNKFERLDLAKNRNIEGTGLGMAITTRLLGLMDSQIEVDSVYGEGSTFAFSLVQRIVDSTAIEKNKLIAEKNRGSDDNSAKYIAPDAKLLVVDDNAINRLVFVKLLGRIKVQIDEADSGMAALELCDNKKYDIIFLDHMMPELDGIETLKMLRADVDSPNIDTPVIALTANALASSRELYLENGFDGYLSKPIIPDQLEKLIYSFLSDEKIEKLSQE